jgi:hypothetical protein
VTEFVFLKSSYSGGDAGQQCVEVASDGASGTVAVRDSKDVHGPILRLDLVAWRAFTRDL